jgi:undecaprenyl-diphosphatase
VSTGWAVGTLLLDVLDEDDANRIDLPVVRWIVDRRTPWLTDVMQGVSWVGNAGFLLPLIAVLGLLAFRRTRSWATMAELALSVGGAMSIYYVIKPLVARPRPRVGDVVSIASGHAFPSGHTTQTTALAVTLAIMGSGLTTSWSRRATIWSLAVLGSLAMGLSRVYLGVHWPTDVLGGLALGALWAALSAVLIRGPSGAAGDGVVAPEGSPRPTPREDERVRAPDRADNQ